MKWGLAALVATLIICLGLEAHAEDSYDQLSFTRYLYRYDPGGRVLENGVFATPVPGFAELERERHNFTTYEQFLDYLFQRAPSLKRHFVLLHHSQSLQLASPDHPRALLFDGGVVFSIAEHPENGPARVEMMEVDRATREVHLRDIAFGPTGAEFNPAPVACLSCHGRPAKPLWDPYDLWPNAFGGNAARIITKQEADAYDRLRANAAASPLFSRLELPEKLDLSHEQINAFTYYISQIGFTRFWKTDLNHDFGGFRPALLATLNLCFSPINATYEQQKADLLAYFQPGVLSAQDVLHLDEIYFDITAARTFTRNFLADLVPRFFENPDYVTNIDHGHLDHERAPLALIRWLLDLSGVNAANLGLSLTANDYLISTPTNFPLDLLATLYESRPDLFANLNVGSRDLGTRIPGWLNLDCAQLKTLSLAARPTPTPGTWRAYTEMHPERPVISRCAKCHTEGMRGDAPEIPFYNSLAFARRLRTSDLADKILLRIRATDRTQMPPGAPLTRAEKDSMAEFIRMLR